MQIAVLDRPELKDEPWRPITQARLHAAHGNDELFAEIRRSDIFVHHPYESFATSVERFIDAAVDRPGRARAEDDRVPDERRVAGRPGARSRRRGRASRACASSS